MSQPISMKGMPVTRVYLPFAREKILTEAQREYQKERQSQIYDQMMRAFHDPNAGQDTLRFLTSLIEEQI